MNGSIQSIPNFTILPILTALKLDGSPMTQSFSPPLHSAVFRWPVPLPANSWRWEESEGATALVHEGLEQRVYEPLKECRGLFMDFGQLEPTPDDILGFVAEYGLPVAEGEGVRRFDFLAECV